MLDSLILDEKKRFILFGGKGGVGKTSVAAASAIFAAQHEKKTLIISTDPAHSLSDSFAQDLTLGELSGIKDIPNLWALELDPQSNLNSNIQSVSNTENDPSSSANNGDFLNLFQNFSFPGMDEAFAFTKIVEYMDNDQFDLIIFDTAPTGHTLRFLNLPNMLSGFLGKIIKLKIRFKKLFSGISSMMGKNSKDSANIGDEFERLKDLAEIAKEILTDEEKTSFVVVLIPEVMAIYESDRLLGSLLEYEINANYMVVNHIVPENTSCGFCQNRRKMQLEHLNEIKSLYDSTMSIISVPEFESEIRGISQLEKLGEKLTHSNLI